MREIGEFKEEEKANAFSAFLHAEGIDNQAEEDDGIWTVWVQDEESLDRATRELERFRENPHRSEYLKAARVAQKNSESEKEQTSARGRFKQVNLGRRWRTRVRPGSVTMAMISITAVVFLLTGMGEDPANHWRQKLSITAFDVLGNTITWKIGLPEIYSGQIWRLLTPVFIHIGAIHFLFNMMWLFDLGGMIENRKGAVFLAFFVLLTGILSNLGQFFAPESLGHLLGYGPNFGGMSGVVYAFFGYAWMKGKYDPGDGIGVPPSTVIIMVGWFVLCFTPILPGIANAAHAIGLGAGTAWGYFSAVKWRR